MEDLANVKGLQINEIANEKGREFKSIHTNQLRNVFSAVNGIKTKFINRKSLEEIKDDLILLKPKLAYAKGRQPKIEPFQRFMFEAIDSVANSKNFERALTNFFALVEAIVAYHKYYGGKD